MSETDVQPAEAPPTLDIPCATQDPREPAPPRYLDICAQVAALISTSRHCPDGVCGGHPVCRPCYDLGRAEGLVL